MFLGVNFNFLHARRMSSRSSKVCFFHNHKHFLKKSLIPFAKSIVFTHKMCLYHKDNPQLCKKVSKRQVPPLKLFWKKQVHVFSSKTNIYKNKKKIIGFSLVFRKNRNSFKKLYFVYLITRTVFEAIQHLILKH